MSTGEPDPMRAFGPFLDYLNEIDSLLQLSMFAIRSMKGIVRLNEVLARTWDKPAEDAEFARMVEQAASNEVTSGFPLLINHSVVALWSALEDTIPRVCSDWLLAYPILLQTEAFSKVRIPPSSLLAEDRATVMEEIIQELSKSTNSPIKAGVGRFDALLAAIGIRCQVSDEIRRDLFELSKLRNVIVHQFGRADRKFLQECPWLGLSVGDRRGKIADDLGASLEFGERHFRNGFHCHDRSASDGSDHQPKDDE